MLFAKFLKTLLNQFVEDYQRLFVKTFGYALLWTIICFAIGQVLAAYSNYDPNITLQPLSILSYFSLNFSLNTTYSFVDSFKILFIFFLAAFSANLVRKINTGAVIYLILTLVLCVCIDFGIFNLGTIVHNAIFPTGNGYLYRWAFSILALLRLFIPYILFALAIQAASAKLHFSFAKLLYLFISIWLFYEVSYELMQFLRDNVFALVLIPFKTKIYSYVMESLLALPLIASFFVGYFCAMTRPFDIIGEKN